MQVAAAGTGVRLSDGSTNVLPVGRPRAVRAAWALHMPAGPPLPGARALPGLGPAPGAAADPVRGDLPLLPDRRHLEPRSTGCAATWHGASAAGFLDEPATARALAGFLLPRPATAARVDAERGASARPGSTSSAALAARRFGLTRVTRDRRPRSRGSCCRTASGTADGRASTAGSSRSIRRRTPAVMRPTSSSAGTTRCCCPVWSTPTCTSTSRAAPSGRASPRPPGRPRPAASPPSSTCRSTRIPPTVDVGGAGGQASGRRRPVPRRRRLLGWRGARPASAASPACTTRASSASSAS